MFDDEPPPESPEPDSFLRAEDGMITVLSVVTVFGFAVLASLVASIGTAVNRKIEAQNAADAIAISCSVQRARTLNAVTATNHVTGELMAVVVMHEAIGGLKPKSKRGDTTAEDENLNASRLAYEIASDLALTPAQTPAYPDVSKPVNAEYATLDAYRELKVRLADWYKYKAVAAGVLAAAIAAEVASPLAGPAAPAVALVAQGVQLVARGVLTTMTAIERTAMKAEYTVIGLINTFASKTASIRDKIYDRIPNVRGHSNALIEGLPSLVRDTGRIMGTQNAAKSDIYPSTLPKLLEPEKVQIGNSQPPRSRLFFSPNDPPEKTFKPGEWNGPPAFAHSQLVRATYPWVNYHRITIIKFTEWMLFSKFHKHYRNWTTEITFYRCQQHYKKENTRLYVFTGLAEDRKESAPWTDSTSEAERAFCTLAFAKQDAPMRWAPKFQPSTTPGGTVTFSQSMVYNANPRKTESDDTNYQPVMGWDTLNWDNEGDDPAHGGAIEWPLFKKDGVNCPRIKLNWQAKLVPVSLLGKAYLFADFEFRGALNRINPFSSLAHGH